MFEIILLAVMIIMAISLYTTYLSATKPKKEILLGIFLPYKNLGHAKVREIVNRYKMEITILFICALITTPLLFLINYTSFIIFYMVIWFVAYMIISNHIYKKHNHRLLLRKSQNRWFPVESQMRVVTEPCNSEIKKLLANTKEPLYLDDDEYWIRGGYYNPNDPRTTVDKRFGFGTTYNMATKIGKMITYGGIGVAIVLICFVLVLFVRFDFAKFELIVNDNIVKIQAPVYDFEFNMNEIEDISLEESMPKKGIRTNGAATKTYLLGNFNYESIGKSKVYVYREYTPIIRITLKDLKVFFNTKSEEETMEIYKLLMDKMKH